jgi:hypothetical protein
VAVPNPLRVELGQRLRTYRERARVTLAAIDGDPHLGWYPGKASKVELGQRVPTQSEVHRLCDLLTVTASERDQVLSLANAARRRTRMPAHVPDWAASFVLFEQAASSYAYFGESLIPAVLQAPGYARDLLAQGAADDLEQRVAERLVRGHLLQRDGAPQVRVVLDEAALHRLPVDRGAAREQLTHLLEAMTWPTVDVRILPFGTGLHPLLGVGCTLLRLSEPDIARVYLEGATTSTYLHEPDEVKVYEALLDQVWALAADSTESATILRERIQQLG